MSKPIERYRQSDVNFWGIAAIAATGLALGLSSLPALVPASVFTALHASRLDGGDVNSLRARLASLSDEAAQLRIDNAQLVTRVGLAERARGDITKRVGALENSLPVLLEQIPPGSGIDNSIVTSSVGSVTQIEEISGGSIEVSRTPLFPEPAAPTPIEGANAGANADSPAGTPEIAAQPSYLDSIDTNAFGMAMGATVSVSDAYLTWLDLRNKVGALLIGMEPILSGNGGGYHIVAGPVDRIAQAEEICSYVERAGLQCLPVPYDGYKLPM